MFIELADHLRCPAEHVEAYLVLLPGRVEDRSVVSGHLGCPICGWGVGFEGGAVDFGGGRPATGVTRWTAPAVQALLGISGPGGYVALVGTAAGLAPTLAPLLPGVRRALRNRPFRILLLAGIVSSIPAAIPAILLPYFVLYVLQPADPGAMVGLFLATYLGTGLLCVPLWRAVAGRIGNSRLTS